MLWISFAGQMDNWGVQDDVSMTLAHMLKVRTVPTAQHCAVEQALN